MPSSDRDDDDDDRPRRRRRDEDDDEDDDRPRRRRDNGDGPYRGPSGPLDNMFANTNIVVLVLFGLCCGIIAFILALVCVLTAQNPKAKSNAIIVLIIGAVLTVIGAIVQFGGLLK